MYSAKKMWSGYSQIGKSECFFSMDATIPLSSSDSGKGKTHGTKSDDGRSASPEKVNAKVDSRQIEVVEDHD
ncbi:hypothetical protein DICVIV_11705 [Dictyocaulus viviparus]|uniref:Uncharacterized protein n=1 Tax=Dictyocaulus viviparus TaxID=29172 RepID=A0A0D8XCI8_DICVI|nr:hypothetical protein DICVIV_11705 [Dictyocaulus viviparus]